MREIVDTIRYDTIRHDRTSTGHHPHTPPPHPPSAAHGLPDLLVTDSAQNDSASVGWMPTRESKSFLVAPSLTANANPYDKM